MIEVTSAAKAYFSDLCRFTDETAILLSVNNRGCGGHSYQLHFVPDSDEEAIDLGDCRLLIDPRSRQLLADITIDCHDDGLQRIITFTNPQEVGRCGCGMSFRTDAGCGAS